MKSKTSKISSKFVGKIDQFCVSDGRFTYNAFAEQEYLQVAEKNIHGCCGGKRSYFCVINGKKHSMNKQKDGSFLTAGYGDKEIVLRRINNRDH